MHIKEVSKKTGITSDTIRYYERINLIPPIHRSESGIREFTQNDIDILEAQVFPLKVSLIIFIWLKKAIPLSQLG